MARRRDRYGSEHVDRGDGVCDWCFEEWPCDVSRGLKRSGGIQEWAEEHRKEQAAIKEAEVKLHNEKIKSVLGPLGIDVRLNSYGGSVYIELKDLHKLACLLEAYALKESSV